MLRVFNAFHIEIVCMYVKFHVLFDTILPVSVFTPSTRSTMNIIAEYALTIVDLLVLPKSKGQGQNYCMRISY